ncbi:hypothetical protein [Nocardia paucivorans]|uniref:hypothetical protein n=1 Tax=Nocardia paucivorans TaxID=114259 RepID=UPI0002FA0351|nr:hypothetical protein [Nocardia paucivorans]
MIPRHTRPAAIVGRLLITALALAATAVFCYFLLHPAPTHSGPEPATPFAPTTTQPEPTAIRP